MTERAAEAKAIAGPNGWVFRKTSKGDWDYMREGGKKWQRMLEGKLKIDRRTLRKIS